ncbi:MAG: putative DNA binding domain-containing protein [Candidatus Sericytochromatia bacterium]|nr:putative DNA binding domain-containing protein [Candidatus Sericytochromatia bacterium]
MKKENQNTEWKESWRDEYLKWICGFANAQGGVLVIGKNDRGQPVGVSDTRELLETLPNKIRDLLGIVADVNVFNEAGHELIEIKDYGSGAPIQIRVYDHKITVGNASVLPEDWSVQDLTQEHESRPFNPDIAHVFFRAGQIETWGRGIEKIFDACAAAGLPEPRYGDTGATLRLTFPFATPPINTPDPGKSAGNVTQETTQEKMITLLKNTPKVTGKELAIKLGITEHGVKYHLNKLKAAGLIRHVGPTKGGDWEVLK